MANVNPRILTWARETAGLSLVEAARKLDIGNARGETGELRLERFELGEREPSKALLQKMAKQYRRSLLVFYLESPPAKGDRGQDFRTVSNSKASELNPTLDALVRNIRGRQRLIKSVLEDEESEPLSYVGSADLDGDPKALAQRITEVIGFELKEYREQRSVEDAFTYLRRKVEASGVFVLLAGNLGSYHTNIPSDTFRGYAISDPVAPLIIINDQDARIAWAFTVLHELTHIWLGSIGVSGELTNTRVEVFCNRVAGSILLSEEDATVLAGFGDLPVEESLGILSAFANERKVSRSMVAYRFLLSGLITEAKWTQISDRLRQDWQSRQQSTDEKKAQSGGPSYYVVKRHRLGPALRSLVQRALSDGTLTYTKAGQILDVKPLNVQELLNDAPIQRAA